jgi:hypothetical protein
MNETLKPLGVIAIALLWAALITMVKIWGRDNTMTFSKHAGTNRKAFIILGVVQAIVLPTFTVFTLGWFSPRFQMPLLFDVMAVLSAAGFLFASWLPDTGKGVKSAIHGTSAYTGAMLLVPLTAIICLAPDLPTFARITGYANIAWTCVGVSWYLSTEKAKGYVLHIQAGAMIWFHILILSATYLS